MLYLESRHEQFSLFKAIVGGESSYACRIRDDHHFTPKRMLPLSEFPSRSP